MIFAVAMTFIDQTIVSIAAPTIQHDLGLSSSGVQWAINAYLLTLAAFFAFGGRLADTHGHRKMVVLGVIIFAGASALCGATPRGSAAEAWLVAFRALRASAGRSCSRPPSPSWSLPSTCARVAGPWRCSSA
jgi:MFS family permease